MRGTVKTWYEQRGYGFITGEDGNDYFVHYTEVDPNQIYFKKGRARRDLGIDCLVEFEPDVNDRGFIARKVGYPCERES